MKGFDGRRGVAVAVMLGGVLLAADAVAQAPTAEDIDALALRAMEAFQTPGIAVGVVKDGQVIYARGHGVREIGRPEMVDADTIFQIASLTKAFTAASLGILVDEGKLAWDDPVIDYLPDFRMYDPWYGDVFVEGSEEGLVMRFSRSDRLTGPLEHFQYDTFIARWFDRSLHADAYVTFVLGAGGGVEKMKMKMLSPDTDFSYDFHDLDLRRVAP